MIGLNAPIGAVRGRGWNPQSDVCYAEINTALVRIRSGTKIPRHDYAPYAKTRWVVRRIARVAVVPTTLARSSGRFRVRRWPFRDLVGRARTIPVVYVFGPQSLV